MSFFNRVNNVFQTPSVQIYFSKSDAIRVTQTWEEPPETPAHAPAYSHQETVSGRIVVSLPNFVDEWDFEHITVSLIGEIRSQMSPVATVISQQQLRIDEDGTFTQANPIRTYAFSFENSNLLCESFRGSIFEINYCIQVDIQRLTMIGKSVTERRSFLVVNKNPIPQERSEKLEIGVERCLHLQVDYENTRLDVNDMLKGQIRFTMNKLKIESMHAQILQREDLYPVSGCEIDKIVETTSLGSYEIMEGCPEDDDIIPIHIPLAPFNLHPTLESRYADRRYFINIILLDKDARRYFKHSEIFLHRSSYPFINQSVTPIIEETKNNNTDEQNHSLTNLEQSQEQSQEQSLIESPELITEENSYLHSQRTYLREKRKEKKKIHPREQEQEHQNHQPITSLNSHQVLQITQEIEDNKISPTSSSSSFKNIKSKNPFKHNINNENILVENFNNLDLDPLNSTEIYTTVSINTEPAPELLQNLEQASKEVDLTIESKL